MYIKPTMEWWKLRVYQDVSEFLKNPSVENRSKLNAGLESYQAFCGQHKSDISNSHDDNSQDSYERLISA